VKSVSALWAIAPLPVAEQIEAAHDAAVADVLEWLQDSAAFTRTGANGVAQVDTEGSIAAAFTHRDSRAGDPDFHTHVAVSNKVSHVDANGVRRWLALDGQPLHRVTVAASELYNTQLEAHLTRRIGVRFVEQSRRRGKRPVREIDGMSPELMSRWSSRRAAIEARTAELAKQFQADHGREPTNVEIIALAQQATLESREAKHKPRSLAEQRHIWRTQAVEVLGRTGLHQMLTDTLAPVRSETAVCHRRGRPAPTALPQGHPPRHRRRRPHPCPGPRRRPGVGHHRRPRGRRGRIHGHTGCVFDCQDGPARDIRQPGDMSQTVTSGVCASRPATF
jgi:conjugative relaxase-like TrwC/TraI family protein